MSTCAFIRRVNTLNTFINDKKSAKTILKYDGAFSQIYNTPILFRPGFEKIVAILPFSKNLEIHGSNVK